MMNQEYSKSHKEQSISQRSYDISKIQNEDLKKAIKCIKKKILDYLTLHQLHKLDNEDQLQLIRFLQENRSLTYLKLSGNTFTGDSAQALGEILKCKTTVKTLELCDCPSSREGIKVISEGLQKNQTLTTLSVWYTRQESFFRPDITPGQLNLRP